MSTITFTIVEAKALIFNVDACVGCRQEAAKILLMRGSKQLTDKEAFQARLLNNSGAEAHTCKGAQHG